MALPVWLDISLQIIVALTLLFIVYLITLSVLNVDAIVNKPSNVVKEKEITLVVDGYAGPSTLKNYAFNTVNPYVDNFKRIARSVNRIGGASFTYQFWLRVDEPDDTLFNKRIIFVKGDTRQYKVGYYNKVGDTSFTMKNRLGSDYHINCPMISFGSSYREIVVSFNTTNDIRTQIRINMNSTDDPSSRKNLLSMLPMRWMLMTFIFEDNVSLTNSFENGIKFSFYANDIPYWSETASSSAALYQNMIKQNDGDLFFVPDFGNTSDFFKIGNFRYYNYAVSSNDITSTFNVGPPTYSASANGRKDTGKSILTAVNKLDIYNY